MEKIRILVTGACGVTSRSVVRSLNKSEIFAGKCNFIGTDVCYNEYGIYEGLYKRVYKVPYFNSEAYRPLMEKIIEENKIEYAILIKFVISISHFRSNDMLHNLFEVIIVSEY